MSDDFSDLSRSSLFALQGERAIVPVESASGPALIWPVGRVVDNKFEILALIGEGSMGRVYRVRHLLLKREVALKTIASVARGEAFLERFRREAQAIARLSHKNIIQVFDFGFIEEKFPYYTMECLTGCTLEQKLAKRGSLDLKQTVEIFVQICRALAAAHSKGIIHRDLKPANIFLADGAAYGSQTWVVKVVDFGVSTMALPDQPTEPKLTQADMIFGSPLYMSPEQTRAEPVSAASDIYACGCMLYEALVGNPPFVGANAMVTMAMHQGSAVPRLRDVIEGYCGPQRLEALLARMLAKDPLARPQSFAAVADELDVIGSSAQRIRHVREGQNNGLQGAGQAPVNRGSKVEDRESHAFEASDRAALAPLRILAICLAALSLLGLAIFFITPRTAPTSTINNLPPAHKAIPPIVALYLQPDAAEAAKGNRVFDFPFDRPIGYLHWVAADWHARSADEVPAQGKVIVPLYATVHFDALRPVYEHSEYFQGFGPHDISRLTLKHLLPWGKEHIAQVGRLSGLYYFAVTDTTNVSDECVNDLNNLTAIRELLVSDTAITGAGLSHLHRLRDLWRLYACSLKDMPVALGALSGSSSLKEIQLDGCQLRNGDLALLAKIPSLQVITLNNNPVLSDDGLKHLADLPTLKSLQVKATSITPASLEQLRKMPMLTELIVDGSAWQAAGVEEPGQRLQVKIARDPTLTQ